MSVSQPVYVFGEPMVELAGIDGPNALLGVGGDTFNTAVYLSRAGVPVEYVTALGTDPFSARVRDALHREGIGTKYVLTHPDRVVGLYAIEVDSEGERRFTYWRSHSAVKDWFSIDGADAAMEAMASAGNLYLSGISLSLFEQNRQAQLIDLMGRVNMNGGMVGFDTNYRPKGWASAASAQLTVRAAMPSVTLALPTFEDDQALFNVPSPEECARMWSAGGASEVCVKAGPRGAFLSLDEWVAPDHPLAPVDTTGAGDSFNAAYLAARLGGQEPAEAARAANALAGAVLMTRGAILPR